MRIELREVQLVIIKALRFVGFRSDSRHCCSAGIIRKAPQNKRSKQQMYLATDVMFVSHQLLTDLLCIQLYPASYSLFAI
jgi:hypothetical protein